MRRGFRRGRCAVDRRPSGTDCFVAFEGQHGGGARFDPAGDRLRRFDAHACDVERLCGAQAFGTDGDVYRLTSSSVKLSDQLNNPNHSEYDQRVVHEGKSRPQSARPGGLPGQPGDRRDACDHADGGRQPVERDPERHGDRERGRR